MLGVDRSSRHSSRSLSASPRLHVTVWFQSITKRSRLLLGADRGPGGTDAGGDRRPVKPAYVDQRHPSGKPAAAPGIPFAIVKLTDGDVPKCGFVPLMRR